MSYLGVPEYRATPVERVADLEAEAPRLRELVGSPLLRSFVLWDASADEWFTDAPLVLDFGVTRLEIAPLEGEICVSWDAVDITAPTETADGPPELEWRRDQLPEVNAFLHQAVEEISVIAYFYEPWTFPEEPATSNHWINGLGFRARDAYFEVFNSEAVGELGVADSADPRFPDTIRLPLP